MSHAFRRFVSAVERRIVFGLSGSTTKFVRGDGEEEFLPEFFMIAVSDETTAITTGTAKVTFRAPYALKLLALPRANVNTQSSSGAPAIDINKSGSTIFTTTLTIDANEETSVTAATPAVLNATPVTFADDEEITIDIDTAGTGAKGLKVTFYWQRTA